jgi:hypothetical protein
MATECKIEELRKLTDFLKTEDPELDVCFPLEDAGTGFTGHSKPISEPAAP